jgi:hypothetical protein
VHLGEALAVGVAAHVHRDAFHEEREVGAVVRIEAANQVLVRLAAPGVLGGEQARDDFQDAIGPVHAAHREASESSTNRDPDVTGRRAHHVVGRPPPLRWSRTHRRSPARAAELACAGTRIDCAWVVRYSKQKRARKSD